MKKMFILSVALFGIQLEAQSATTGFCWAVKESGVYCTAIAAMPPVSIASRLCAAYASGIGASESGVYRNTSSAAMVLKQEQECNYVANNPKYQCFVQTSCVATSSISPTSRFVFAAVGATEDARIACVDKAASDYLTALKGAGAGCAVAAKAVMTLP